MDISYDGDEIIKKCFKCTEDVICNLNIVNNAANTTFTLWNKFQMFVYEDLEFESAPKVIVPEFQIYKLFTTNNYLLCMDVTGNVHTTPLKFKNAAQKRFKYGFQPRDNNIFACSLFSEDYTMCLKYELDTYFLNVHRINTEFTLVKRTMLITSNPLLVQQRREKHLLKSYLFTENHLEVMKRVFNTEDINNQMACSIVVITFDKLNVYGCLYSTNMPASEVSLVKLYTCPSEIASIDFVESNDFSIIIGLTIGTIICLNLRDRQTPQIIHLNTGIYKLLASKDTVLYTDGVTMWKAENILSNDIRFSQFLVKDVKDFIKFGDQIICTTFKDLIYTFSIDDERSYVKVESVYEFFCADQVLSHTQYIENITVEVLKNEALLKVLKKERTYVIALSLSNRQDVVDDIIRQKVIVYESYEDAISEHTNVTLTNHFCEYFDSDSFYFLIKINTATEHHFKNILSESIGDLRLHVTILSKSKVVKTTTVKITEVLRNVTLLIPLKTKDIDITDMRVQTKLVTNIPGAFDPKQTIWIILYRKTSVLNSEHFIKFNLKPNNTICLKESRDPIEKLILETNVTQYGTLFNFSDVTIERPILKKWHMYIKLPLQYEELFKNVNLGTVYTSKKVSYFLQQFTSEEFMKSRSNLCMSVANEKVSIEVDNDGFSTPTMKVSSYNAKITLDIRNFLANIIYCFFTKCEPGKEFISHSFYITVENLQKAVRDCETTASEDDIIQLIEQFERKVIGCLPI